MMSPCWAAAKWQESNKAKTGVSSANFLKRNLLSVRVDVKMRLQILSDVTELVTYHHNFILKADSTKAYLRKETSSEQGFILSAGRNPATLQ
jgi:hypothetical protein